MRLGSVRRRLLVTSEPADHGGVLRRFDGLGAVACPNALEGVVWRQSLDHEDRGEGAARAAVSASAPYLDPVTLRGLLEKPPNRSLEPSRLPGRPEIGPRVQDQPVPPPRGEGRASVTRSPGSDRIRRVPAALCGLVHSAA